MSALALVLALAADGPTVASTPRTFPGTVVDVIAADGPGDAPGKLYLSVTGRDDRRALVPFRPSDPAGPAVPSRAAFVDRCAVDDAGAARFLFVDADGVVDDAGVRVMKTPALLAVPDPSALYVGGLCGERELLVAVRDGIAARARDGTTTVLRFEHRARAYSGRVHRGLRPARAYASALSIYGPRLFEADVDGDGAPDLIVAHEDRVAVFLRGPEGRLSAAAAAELDLLRAFGIDDAAEHDLRVHVGDVDGDARADVVVGVTAGALPERSRAFAVTSEKRPLGTPRRLWDAPGLTAPISVIDRGGPRLLVSEVDTTMMALGAVLLSGSVDVRLSLRTLDGAREAGPVVPAAVDVRNARMKGALPITDVDFDGDGLSDLLDLGTPGRAQVFLGTARGYASAPAAELAVPPFVHVVALPRARAVVLIGPPERRGRETSTRVAVVGPSPAPTTTSTWR